MAVDTQSKRMSAVARRRLPWLRRFTLPIPDGEIALADRQHLLGLYAGIEAGEEVGEARYLGTADIEPKYLGTAGISRAYDGTASIGPTYLGTAGVNQ